MLMLLLFVPFEKKNKHFTFVLFHVEQKQEEIR